MNSRRASDPPPDKVLARELKIVNQLGLHARPAALFVKTASRYESDVTVDKDGNSVSGKSIMGLMTLEAGLGSILRVTAQGPDAEQVLDELEALVAQKFYED
jgi:phosphocarrier protein HPr